ncbi:23S rRNA (guanosine(2251)-2'-O)-methyltransferase RlmB [Microlunatus panaciterrae]|uniref:23S rRNA (Guanosine2251-2'-O)-methyltransferase n=1 Tax=Microlunatus panaciterrae TaxID=400768 RepID=A0ABS2RIA1_9ACTN|nr:23S rRNA (guanosine(2251)-2'-O)-methyltransferase RlmB [Microlunatus panaciterrae]MBM7798297.1 23S rRNA (guanosine2251-2'-O)-methyltransferase [Microlunatus panaciterrae]
MPGNSQRKGAVRRKGKGNTAGSGGRVRRGLEGRGPTPKAEDRPYHKAYKAKQSSAGRPVGRSGSQTQRTGRPGAGPEWVAGRNPVLEALQAEIPIQAAYIAEGAERDDRLREILKLTAARGKSLLEVTRAELDRMTGGAVHQGVALQLPAYSYTHPDDLLAKALESDTEPIVVALDSITDPRNLGAIVRSAAAFGATGVLIPERRSAGMTAAAWKTSAGAAARIPIARATNLNRALRAYADAGFSLVGLDGAAEQDITDLPQATGPLVLIVGSEGEGLSRLVREACEALVSIPITGMESLNAGVAAGIALYEIARARQGS